MAEDRHKGVLAGYKKLGPTSRFVFLLSIASAVFTVVGFVLGLIFSEYYYIRSQRASMHFANVTMARPTPSVRKFPVIIEDGTNTQTMPTPGRYAPAFSQTPFSFFITADGTINLRGEIRDAEGTIVAEAIGDSIRVIQANKFDVNSDSKAIEVVDVNQRPVFQLTVIPYEDFAAERVRRRAARETKYGATSGPQEESLKEKTTEEVIRLSYVTQRGETWLVSSRHGSEMVNVLDEYEWSKIPRLFCYPGYSHPGKRVNRVEE
ncbi:MAG: hypothetical protein NTZ17_13860 [Phycisphaerae bacterium]|nr:hypothetical protein [Phycisphaerae bacterium]